jgi:hypothetical protein
MSSLSNPFELDLILSCTINLAQNGGGKGEILIEG